MKMSVGCAALQPLNEDCMNVHLSSKLRKLARNTLMHCRLLLNNIVVRSMWKYFFNFDDKKFSN